MTGAIGSLLDDLQRPRRMERAFGPGTVAQHQVAALVNGRLGVVRPDLAGVTVEPGEVTLNLERSVLSPTDERAAQRLQDAFNRMSDADLGKAVRQAQRHVHRYADQSDRPSAELLRHAVHALQAAVVGVLRGGATVAMRGITEEHNRFDRQLHLAVNGELAVVRAESEQFVNTQRADLARLVEEAGEALRSEQASRQDAHDMALAAADHAQADASQARRELEAASAQLARERGALTAEIERLRGQLATERQAVINRERETRNTIHQLEADKTVLQGSVAHLNQECERLETERKETVMPKSVDLRPTSALERASLCAYLRGRGAPQATWDERGVRGPDVTILAIDLRAWRAAYPTPDAMLAQLRAVVRPILARWAA